jgi:hypothetical protein
MPKPSSTDVRSGLGRSARIPCGLSIRIVNENGPTRNPDGLSRADRDPPSWLRDRNRGARGVRILHRQIWRQHYRLRQSDTRGRHAGSFRRASGVGQIPRCRVAPLRLIRPAASGESVDCPSCRALMRTKSRGHRVRAKSNFARQFNAGSTVQSPRKNKSLLFFRNM